MYGTEKLHEKKTLLELYKRIILIRRFQLLLRFIEGTTLINNYVVIYLLFKSVS